MSESSIASVRGAVYHLDTSTKGWLSVDGGLSRIDIYYDPSRRAYRVVAMGKTQTVVINSPVFKELNYQKASAIFHSWSDGKISYGLNFATQPEADAFASTMADCINNLKEGTNPPYQSNRTSLTFSQPPLPQLGPSSSLNIAQPPPSAPKPAPAPAPAPAPSPAPAPTFTSTPSYTPPAPAPAPAPAPTYHKPAPAPAPTPVPGPSNPLTTVNSYSSIRPGAPPPPPPPPKAVASPPMTRERGLSLADQLASPKTLRKVERPELPPRVAPAPAPASASASAHEGAEGTAASAAPARPHPAPGSSGGDMMGELAAKMNLRKQHAVVRDEGSAPPAHAPPSTPASTPTPTPTPSVVKPAGNKLPPRKPNSSLAPTGLAHSASAPSPASASSTDSSEIITLTRAELAAFRQEIIDSFRREMAAAKQEILQEIGK